MPFAEEWLLWASQNKIDERIIFFLEENPNYLKMNDIDKNSEDFEFYVRIFEEGKPKSQPTNSKFPLKLDKNISVFLRIINRFFSYGIDKIDVIQFDTEIKGEVLTIKKAQKTLQIRGRGGTNFQAMYNFVEKNNHYDGVIFFTDGYASPPVIKFRPKARFLWILENEECYNAHKNWLKKYGKVTFIQ